MKIFLGSDHAAYDVKSKVKNHLLANGHEVVDCGTDSLESCHYPEYAKLVAEAVCTQNARGILICGSGIGVSMVANRYANVRAALVHSVEEAKLSRQHNDSNILCFGARTAPSELHLPFVDAWLSTEYEGGRHQLRLDQFSGSGLLPFKGAEYANGFERAILIGLMTIMFIVSMFGRFKREYYETIIALEDGFLEWATVIALVGGALVSVRRVCSLWKVRPPLFRLALLLLSAAFIFGVGEEISWGQRIFSWSSPEYFVNNNSQGETNLHNLVVDGVKINKIIFGTGLGIAVAIYFLMLPTYYRRRPKWRLWINQLGLPMPKLIHVLFYISLVGLAHFTGSSKKGELLEFGGCWIFFLMILWPYNGHLFDATRSWQIIQKSDERA